MRFFAKSWVTFFIPGGIVFLAAVGFLRPNGLPSWIQPPIDALPYIVLSFGLIFGWYLSSSRLILSLLVLALADRAVVLYVPADSDLGQMGTRLFAATAFLLPLNLLAFSLIKEQAIATGRGVARMCLVLVQPFCVLWLALPEQADLARSLQRPLISVVSTDWSILPQPALFTFLVSGLLVGLRFVLEKNPLDGGALWGLTASFAGLQGLAYGWAPTRFFAVAGLILFLTLIQWSHQRAYRDDLTGLSGRLAFTEAAAHLPQRYVLAIVEVDQLKQYGNRHGKHVSEQLLRTMAPKVQAAAGRGQVYRLSGLEFTILFLNMAATDTLIALEAIRKVVEQCYLCLKNGVSICDGSAGAQSDIEPLVLTVSIGLAEANEAHASLDLVNKAAYRALYEAKANGGNLVKRSTVPHEAMVPLSRERGRIIACSEFER